MTHRTPAERVEFLREWSPEAAEAFCEVARNRGFELDYTPASLGQVERLIDKKFTNWRGRIPEKWHDLSGTTGAYVAEVILRNVGGDWDWEPEFQRGGLRLPNGTFTSPLDKARKRYENGAGDDFVSYYAVLAEHQ